ncbi:glycosyltransferase [Xenophilus aerolatus]|nr:glycosyltransferase [Xenophilus aerolatus]
MADPDLLTLERPDDIDLAALGNPATSRQAVLEPVFELGQMRQSTTTVCFVVSTHGHDPAGLERTMQSILRQTDPGWEALLCCDSVEDGQVAQWLDIDWRVRRQVRKRRFVIETEDLLAACLQATTVFIGLVSAGDVLDDDLVKRIGEQARSRSEADLVYTDEAHLVADEKVGAPFYKPDWSPEYQQAVNMLGRFVAIRKALLLNVAPPVGLHAQAAEYALLLHAAAHARTVAHVDDIMYVRATDAPRPGGFFSEDALADASRVLELFAKQEIAEARVEPGAVPGSLHVRWPAPAMPVTLLILSGMQKRELPGLGEVTLATHFVRSIIEKSTARDYRIIVVDDGVVDEELRALLDQHGHSACTCPPRTPFSFAYKANFATSLVESGIALLLNDDLEVISPDWIQELSGQAARREVGVAGCRLLFGDGTLQHAGIALGHGGAVGHVFHAAPADGSEYAGMASIDRNWSGVTGAVMAYRKEVFDEVGGFDPALRTDYNDVDFCLKCEARGYRVVYTPAATLYHFHNSSLRRKHDSSPERDLFLSRWSSAVRRDPYFNKNFQSRSAAEPLVPLE